MRGANLEAFNAFVSVIVQVIRDLDFGTHLGFGRNVPRKPRPVGGELHIWHCELDSQIVFFGFTIFPQFFGR